MLSPEIKRKTEVYLCQQCRIAVPTHIFVPFTGGDDKSDAFDIEPPFTVISISEATKDFDQESTWTLKGTAQVITHQAEVRTPEHAILVRQVYAAIGGLPRDATDGTFSFHGLSVTQMRSASDAAAQAHSDIIEFQAGAGS